MKPFILFLTAASLVANLVLVGLLLAGRNGNSDRPDSVVSATDLRSNTKKLTDPDRETWSAIAHQETSALVQHLRAAGFPPHVVRAIVAARVQESFTPRFKALRPDAATAPFWKNHSVDPRVRQAEFALYREQQQLLRSLLGPDAEPPETSLYQHKRYDTVPADKVQDVKDALRQFEERRQEIFSNSTGTIGAEQQRRIAELEKEYQATLATILEPGQLHEFNLRNSDAARNLRFELSAFNPTEQEFRDIYQLRSNLEPYLPNLSPEEMRRRSEAQNRVQEQIKAMLGPTRAAEFQRATDFSYRQASQLVARLDLPPETTNKMWDVKQDIEQRAMALRRDTSLASAQRTQQLAALADEAGQRVATLLGGPRGLEAFKQNGGYWIDALKPRPTPAPPGSTTTTTIIQTRGP